MNIIFRPRRTGKTTELVKISAEKNVPILTNSKSASIIIECIAQELGLKIPAPISVNNQYETCIRRRKLRTVLVDDANIILLMLLQDKCAIDSVDTIALSSTEELIPPHMQPGGKKCRKTDVAKTRRIEIRVTEDEYRMIAEKADQNGKTMSDLIVSSIFSK